MSWVKLRVQVRNRTKIEVKVRTLKAVRLTFGSGLDREEGGQWAKVYFKIRIRVGVKFVSRVKTGPGIKGQVSEFPVG